MLLPIPLCCPSWGGIALTAPFGAGALRRPHLRWCAASARFLLAHFRDFGARFVHCVCKAVLSLGRQRYKLLRTCPQLLAERGGQFHLFGHELGRGLRAKGGLSLGKAPLQIVAGNGVLVMAYAVNGRDAFLLGLQRRCKRIAVGLEDGLGIKS